MQYLVLRYRIPQNGISHSLAQEVKMKVGDLVKRKVTGQFFIYCGLGMWTGWGVFAKFNGNKRQLQMSEMEVINEEQ